MISRFIKTAAAVFGLSLIASAAFAAPPASARADQPVETAAGTLSFEGMSDRQVLEFAASQVWQFNRQMLGVPALDEHRADPELELKKMVEDLNRLEALSQKR